MSWLQALADELHACGVPRRERQRIVLELSDHIACEPDCEPRLGDPATLAGTFADELATGRTRACALHAFAALALASATLAGAELSLALPHGAPGFGRGHSTALFLTALLGLFVGSQVALVSGGLAAWRALRRRGAARLPAAELALVARRTRIALLAGGVALTGLELQVLDLTSRLPAVSLAVSAALGLLGAGMLALAGRDLTRARRIRSAATGPAGDVFDDLPPLAVPWLRRHPAMIGVLGSLLATLAVAAATGHAERSAIEGLERGATEGLATGLGFLLLGRAVGVWPRRPSPAPEDAG